MASQEGATECQQEVEIEQIKAAFTGRCRVISNINGFSNVVTIQPKDMDVTLKFQLQDSYPNSSPGVVIRSESLSKEEVVELKEILLEVTSQHRNQPMLNSMVEAAEVWLKDHGFRPGMTVKHTPVYLTSEKSKKKQRGKKKKALPEEEVDTKLSSMKTADDVIKRILWDDSLQSDDFLVGYIDRFRGIVEKYFSAFSWEDIASVDYNVLAIPKHRIQYFKYRDVKVWDKLERLDNVFGSTGSKLTIKEVIARYEANHQAQNEREDATETKVSASHSGDTDDEDDSDSDEDGITITIGAVSTPGSAPAAIEDENDCFDEDEKYWTDKLRPNHFLALRISDKDIMAAVEEVQDFILDHEPIYGECCIPQASLHITLCTLGLDTPEQISHAAQVLHDLQGDLASRRPKKPLKLEGVSNFFKRVIYAKVEDNPEFMEFVDYVKLSLTSAGVEIRDNYEYVPHMTIMKVSRPAARAKGTTKVEPWLYEGYSDMSFGTQSVDGIHLCSMSKERQEDGFYICPAHISFDA